jgi:hypothetical protein
MARTEPPHRPRHPRDITRPARRRNRNRPVHLPLAGNRSIESGHPKREIGLWAAVACIATAGFLTSWTLLHQSFWGHHQLVDTPIYEAYADAIRAGDVPYRDFAIEYPPAALPAFLAPELTATPERFGTYGHAFEKWMAACGVVMVLCVVAALAALHARAHRVAAVVAFVTAAPLLLGPVVLSRFDLWPAALTAAGVAAFLWRRPRLGAVMLGLAIAAKLYALVCVPLAFVWVWRSHGARAVLSWSAVLAAVLAVAFAPIAAIAPSGLAHSFATQLGRPLEIESLGAAVLVGVHHLDGLRLLLRQDHGSTNFEGALPNLVANLSTIAQLALLGAVLLAFVHGPASRQRFITAIAASVTIFIAFAKVFSPQYLIWLIPLVPLVGGRRGIIATALLGISLALTQFWFPDRWGQYSQHLRPLESSALLIRDLLIALLGLTLTWSLYTDHAQPTTPTPTRWRSPNATR